MRWISEWRGECNRGIKKTVSRGLDYLLLMVDRRYGKQNFNLFRLFSHVPVVGC